MSDKSGTVFCRTMFSPSEEEVIGKFLISCWKKHLRVPPILLFDTLKKHLDKFPRKIRAKDNKPGHFWRQRFFLRNPHVQEAYDRYKSLQHKDDDVVSDQLLNSFISDLACAEKPIIAEEEKIISSCDVFEDSDIIKKKRITRDSDENLAKFGKATAKHQSSTASRRGRGRPKISLSTQHKRSKSVNAAVLISANKSSNPKNDRSTARKKSFGGFKISPKLLSQKKPGNNSSMKSPKEKTEFSKNNLGLSAKSFEKKDLTLSTTTKYNEIPAGAVPLESVKFVVGANIEAMDGNKWYRAKIIQVYHDKKQILVHFNGWRKRFDTVYSMTSPLIRGPTQIDKKLDLKKFNVGDDVLSQWSDGKFYPGTVMVVKESGSYVVMFYDGLKKLVRPNLLKPLTSEKEKHAALKQAQDTYLLPFDQVSSTVSSQTNVTSNDNVRRRYKTSANDRERRVSLRRVSTSEVASNMPRKSRKRRYTQALNKTPPTFAKASSPDDSYKFQVKQARLDKITDNLLDKAVTTETTTASTSAPVMAKSSISSSYPSLTPSEVDTTYFSDESDNPLIIDEDGECRVDSKTRGKTSTKKFQSVTSASSLTPISSSSYQDIDRNLHQLADAALSNESNVLSKDLVRSGIKREEAGQALLQLAHGTSSNKIKDFDRLDQSELDKLSVNEKIEIALERTVKSNVSVCQAAFEMNLKTEEVHDVLVSRHDIILGSSEPNFMVPSEEDAIVNWIHDVTDLGWGVKNVHILEKVKCFLTSESFLVLFDDESPLNMPSTSWLTDFLSRHPEIFPGREKPLSRFRLDREGFEEWLVRWLAILRSKAVKTNAVYYCDETVWDINARLPEVKFIHQSELLDSTHTNGNKITTISCVGANGDALTPFYIFPDNEKKEKIEKESYTSNVVFSHRGALSSSFFMFWLKNVFVKEIPINKRPVALLVDAQLESVDYEILKFADENEIILYRFLSQGAHFIQHPDQKLFGRLRMQWKKSIFSKFIKDHTGQTVSTHLLADFYNQEFYKIASSTTIKMCFELTKLYVPVAETISDDSPPKERKNKRKNSNPKPYILSKEMATSAVERKVLDSSQIQITSKSKDQLMSTSSSENETGTSALSSADSSLPRIKSSSIKTTLSPNKDPVLSSKKITRLSATGNFKGRTSSLRLRSPKSPMHVQADSSKSDATVQSPTDAASPPTPVLKSSYKKGEIVLAKWTDCKLYSATVVKKIDNENYKIRYFDGHVKTVSTDFLRVWSSDSPSSTKSPPRSSLSSIKSPLNASVTSTKLPSNSSSSLSKSPSNASLPSTKALHDSSSLSPPLSMTPNSNSDAVTTRNQNLRRGILPLSAKRRPAAPLIRTRKSVMTSSWKTAKAVEQAKNNDERPNLRSKPSSESLPDLVYSKIKPEERVFFKVGDSVMCKWSDRRMYPASIIKLIENDRYMVKYYDNRKKVVHYSWVTSVNDYALMNKSKPSAAKTQSIISLRNRVLVKGKTTTNNSSSKVKSPSPSHSTVTNTAAKIPVKRLSKDEAIEQKSKEEQTLAEEQNQEKVFVKETSERRNSTTKETAPKPVPEMTITTPIMRPRRSITKQETKSESSIEKEKDLTNQQASDNSASENIRFDLNELVLARWTDCRNYPATILKANDDKSYEVRYHDGMVKTLKSEMIIKWDPNLVYMTSKSRNRRLRESVEVANKLPEKTSETKPENIKVEKPKASPLVSTRTKTNRSFKNNKPSPLVSASPPGSEKDRKPVIDTKPVRVSLTYEDYYTQLTQESELNKFKCKVPGCNKIFRREPALKQHHKHYHSQRYKLRDQEPSSAIKRKASKEDLPSAKRRLSSESHVSLPSPKSPVPITPIQPQTERLTRSRGGKPPLDVIQQTSEKAMMTLRSEESTNLVKGKIQDNAPLETKKGDHHEKTVLPKRRRRRSDSTNQSELSPVNTKESSASKEEAGSLPVEVVKISTPADKDKDDSLPEYVCKIYKNPPGIRESHKYLYNNDFMTKGILPGGLLETEANKTEIEQEKRFQQLIMATHHVMEELTRLQESLQGIRKKITIADPEHLHPLLPMWKDAIPDGAKLITIENKRESFAPTSISQTEPKADKEAKHDETSRELAKSFKEAVEEKEETSYSGDVQQILDTLIDAVENSFSPDRTNDVIECKYGPQDRTDAVIETVLEEVLDQVAKTVKTDQSLVVESGFIAVATPITSSIDSAISSKPTPSQTSLKIAVCTADQVSLPQSSSVADSILPPKNCSTAEDDKKLDDKAELVSTCVVEQSEKLPNFSSDISATTGGTTNTLPSSQTSIKSDQVGVVSDQSSGQTLNAGFEKQDINTPNEVIEMDASIPDVPCEPIVAGLQESTDSSEKTTTQSSDNINSSSNITHSILSTNRQLISPSQSTSLGEDNVEKLNSSVSNGVVSKKHSYPLSESPKPSENVSEQTLKTSEMAESSSGEMETAKLTKKPRVDESNPGRSETDRIADAVLMEVTSTQSGNSFSSVSHVDYPQRKLVPEESCQESVKLHGGDSFHTDKIKTETNKEHPVEPKHENEAELLFEDQRSDHKQGANTLQTNPSIDLWQPLRIAKNHPSVEPRRSNVKLENTPEEVLLQSRANLLHHIHLLETELSDRLNQLEKYIDTLEASFTSIVGSSPPSSESLLPYDSRLGELQSDLQSLYKDVDKLEKMFL